MGKLFNVTLGFICLIILVVANNTRIDHTNKGGKKAECTKEVYYFQDENLDFVAADRQQFRVLFTGQVANAYFYKNGKEYATTNYYKETKKGTPQGGKCILDKDK